MNGHDFRPPGKARGACVRCGLRFAIVDCGKAASPRFVVRYWRPTGGNKTPDQRANGAQAFPCSVESRA